MWDRYVNYHDMHHIIWVYTLGDEAWYPGDGFVDIVAWDIYTDVSGNMSGQWEEAKRRHGAQKLIAL